MQLIPQMGYGTWNRLGNTARTCVLDALEIGYRHLDCAEGYENEEFVGKAIAESGIARDDLWVTTKVAPESFGPGQVRPHAEASLEKLGVGPVDLLLLHYPSINDEYDIEDYIAQLLDVYEAGLCKHIGVSNFTKKYINRATELLGDIKIFTNQVEIHVYLHNDPIVDLCAEKNIRLTAYCPLARGAVLDDPLLNKIGEQVGGNAAQVSLAWLMAKDYIIIPSAGRKERIADNFAASNIQLSDAHIKQIDALGKDMRLVNGSWCPEWDV